MDVKTHNKRDVVTAILPWTAGAGFAAGHMMFASQCTLVAAGICSGCAGCAIALASLVGWGVCRNERSQARNSGSQ